jgi:hypothetical protein
VPRGEGYEFQTFGANVQGSIEIAIMIETANASPALVRQRERTVYGAARVTGLAGGKETIHDREMPAAPDRLVLQLPSKLSEACIQDRFGQLGSRQALDAQVLDTDRLIVAHQSSGHLVQEIRLWLAVFA